MKNYFAYDSSPFVVTKEEVESLPSPSPIRFTDRAKVKEYMNSKWATAKNKIINFELRPLPEDLKKNNGDSAKLLILYKENGDILAKRHNNSQWLRLE